MGGPEHVQKVGGSAGEAVQTSAKGSVETDNYPTGGGFSFSGGNLPQTVDPPENIEEWVLTKTGTDTTVDVTTEDGTTFTLNLNGTTGAFDKWTVTSLEFKGTSDVDGGWAGE